MKRILALLALVFISAQAEAACGDGASDCFFRAAGNWNTAATWSDTNGGGAAGAFPVAGDTVKCSTSAGTGTYVMNVAFSIANFDMTGCPSGVTLQQDAFTLTITGTTFTFGGSSMTYNPTANSRVVAFNPASGNLTVTSSGKRFAVVTIAAGANSVILGDAIRIDNVASAGSSLTLTSGTLDLNSVGTCPTSSPSLTLVGTFTNTGSSTRAITMGSGCILWTSGIGGTGWTSTGTNYTMNAGTGTITLSQLTGGNLPASTAFNLTHTPAGSYPAISILASTQQSPYNLTYTANLTMASLSIAPDSVVIFRNNITLNITATSNWTGSGYDGTIVLISDSTVAATLAGTINCTWCVIGAITAASGTATNSVRYGGTSGFNSVSGPSGGGSTGIIGGGL